MHDPLSRVPIKYKLTGAFVCICIIAFGVGGYLISSSAGSTLENEIAIRLKSQAELVSDRLDHQLELLGRRAEDFASDGFIRSHLDQLSKPDVSEPRFKQVHAQLREHLSKNKLPLVPAVANISIYDLDGVCITDVFEAWYCSSRDVMLEGINNDSLNVSTFITGDKYGSPVFAVTTPVWDLERTSRIGTLVFWIELPSWLQQAELFTALNETGQTGTQLTLVDNRGVMCRMKTVSDDKGRIRVIPLGTQTQWKENAVFQIGALITFEHDIKHSDWQVRLGMDTHEAMKSISGLHSRFLGAGILVAVAALILLFFPVRFLIKPLVKMRDAASAMMDGDYSVRVDDMTEDEIGDLARSFNSMAAATQERTKKLEETARQLENRSAELRIERDLLTTVIHSMDDGVIYIDANGKVAMHNQKAKALAEDLEKNKPCIKPRIVRNDNECSGDCLSCMTDLQINNPACIVECGNSIFEVLSAQVETGDRQHGRILVARDISDRMRIDERQAHQDRLAVLGEVAATMAHELNNPLAAASMFAQMMDKDILPESPFREHVDVILRNIDVCKRTIRDLLRYARSPEPEIDEIDLEDLISDAVHFLKPVYEQKEISFDLQFNMGSPGIYCDEMYLRQVFINVLMNALQAMDSQGANIVVTAICEPNSKDVLIDIIDDGPGIPAALQDKIFEPFVTTKPSGEGTGLGLSISRTIMRTFYGDLQLLSSKAGETAFRITLPTGINESTQSQVSEKQMVHHDS